MIKYSRCEKTLSHFYNFYNLYKKPFLDINNFFVNIILFLHTHLSHFWFVMLWIRPCNLCSHLRCNFIIPLFFKILVLEEVYVTINERSWILSRLILGYTMLCKGVNDRISVFKIQILAFREPAWYLERWIRRPNNQLTENSFLLHWILANKPKLNQINIPLVLCR